ncbi:hypothetical protein [Achromobacter spanius]|uniref:Uncharacterized protein n=1 Tax=Achromobacter spanius TaxID=217203 RepID=A0A2S0IAT0_9BURK|nr:hypothetical protein [Achromobacter spanius]AVJ29145.1 hypothetical protein CLM73_19630 [Achromobacter spanius]
MTLAEIVASGINPALALLPPKMDTPEARIMLLAIGLQEFSHAVRHYYGEVALLGRSRYRQKNTQAGDLGELRRDPPARAARSPDGTSQP